ncbi:hypothetical protein SCP_0113030 [Sparassis crispa]|uniref:RAD50-interacting protein n=1 Tax=Sparassis crispa TaxID=139825 RepID=A0A401G8B7_9APHY|nr:hypothetical protein SCP_0113030 [Sparassis crispa]GBE78415.1 hypothetical protein SCP_0113030 [Sparassis crispa]
MASVRIQALLQEPDLAGSEKRTLDFLNASFTTLGHLDDQPDLNHTVEQARQGRDQLKAQLSQFRIDVDALIVQSRSDAQTQLHTAQELSLLRHSLADELSSLSEELVSSLAASDGKPTLLENLETLHRLLKELESVRSYVQIIERALKLSASAVEQIRSSSSLSSLSEYEALQQFIASVHTACVQVEDSAGQGNLQILSFLDSVREQTWLDIKNVVSAALLSASEKLHWPTPVDYVSVTDEDRNMFQSAFLNLLKLQTMGEKLHASAKGKGVEREGLYAIQALVQPVSLRFKYHFEGTRQTNRLDKPEWYFAHILNVSHEHRPFMETTVQHLLNGTQYRGIIAWREFTMLLLPLLARKLRHTVPSLLTHPPVLAHTIYQALTFDSTIKDEGFDLYGTTAEKHATDVPVHDREDKKTQWEGISEVILGRREWFEAWLEGERKFAMDQYMEIIMAPDAWLIADDEGEGDDTPAINHELKPTNSARRVKALVEQVTDRYSPLPQFTHRTRFLIAVQLPLLESYHARISASLDAFETLSSSFMRAVPGALNTVGGGNDASGRPGDSKNLTSGVQGVQRLCKALLSAKYMASALEAWGEELFFLELWEEINRRASLRSRVEAEASLPSPKGNDADSDLPEGTIFEQLVTFYNNLTHRAEDMVVHCVCGEVEGSYKAHISGGSTHVTSAGAEDSISLPPTLLAPIALLSSHLSYLNPTLPHTIMSALYRRIASHISLHILQRQILYRGRGRIGLQESKIILAECELWVETCRLALARDERARAEAPWRPLLQAGRLLCVEGEAFAKVTDKCFGVAGD